MNDAELERENAALRKENDRLTNKLLFGETYQRELFLENAALRHALQTALAIESLDDANLGELIARCRCVMREQAAIDAARESAGDDAIMRQHLNEGGTPT